MIEHVVSVEPDVNLPDTMTPAAIQALVSYVLDHAGVDEAWHIGVQFVADSKMQAAHLEYMNIDEPTDIMTFPYADEDDVWGDSEAGGDLIISVDTARENAAAAGWSLADELYFLVTHGLLHLIGWNDHSPEDRAAMLAHQHKLMASWTTRS